MLVHYGSTDNSKSSAIAGPEAPGTLSVDPDTLDRPKQTFAST